MPNNEQAWGRPAGGPWWRFVPRNRWVGSLGILAGVLLLVQAVVVLSDGPSGTQITLEAVCALLGCALLIQSVDGLRVLNRNADRP
ncbi:hypothetical protein [Streptomyces sp. NPDC048489]|uniref:hypothetical protein n=1 Tax=Streptomyces sp. NPDC048489 TaxID=3154504 RepID=UPI003445AA30